MSKPFKIIVWIVILVSIAAIVWKLWGQHQWDKYQAKQRSKIRNAATKTRIAGYEVTSDAPKKGDGLVGLSES